METAYIIRNGVIIGSGTNSSLNPDSSSTYIINCTIVSETGLEIEVPNYDGDFTKIKQTIADGGKVELRTNFNSSNYILEPSRIEENYVTFNTIDKNANITIKVTEYGINDVSYIDLNSSGGATIDDAVTSTDTTWSSKKTSDKIDALISDTSSSTTNTYSSTKIDEKIAEHSLPLVYDTGMFANDPVRILKLANVLKEDLSIAFNNLNLLLSTRRGDEVEIVTGKDDDDYYIQAYRRSNSVTKISAMYKDGYDIYIRLELYANFLRVYHKSGVLRDDFAVSKVDTIPDTATEVTIRPLPTYINDSATDVGSTWSSSKINSKLGGLSFSASGTTLTITNGTNTWTLEANS